MAVNKLRVVVDKVAKKMDRSILYNISASHIGKKIAQEISQYLTNKIIFQSFRINQSKNFTQVYTCSP